MDKKEQNLDAYIKNSYKTDSGNLNPKMLGRNSCGLQKQRDCHCDIQCVPLGNSDDIIIPFHKHI